MLARSLFAVDLGLMLSKNVVTGGLFICMMDVSDASVLLCCVITTGTDLINEEDRNTVRLTNLLDWTII